MWPTYMLRVHSIANGKGGEHSWSLLSTKLSHLEFAQVLIKRQLTDWECTSWQYSKWGEEELCDHCQPNYYSYNKFKPEYGQTCPFKGNLPPESVSDHSIGRSRRKIYYSSHKFNPECAQTCPFMGNLHAERVPDHSTASGQKEGNFDCD